MAVLPVTHILPQESHVSPWPGPGIPDERAGDFLDVSEPEIEGSKTSTLPPLDKP